MVARLPVATNNHLRNYRFTPCHFIPGTMRVSLQRGQNYGGNLYYSAFSTASFGNAWRCLDHTASEGSRLTQQVKPWVWDSPKCQDSSLLGIFRFSIFRSFA